MTTTERGAPPISSCLLDQAAHQNADGAISLQGGDCGRAFHSFVTTLSTLSKSRQYQIDHLPEPPLHCSPAPSRPPPSRPSRNCKAISIPYLKDSGFYIYSNALVFSRRPHIGDQHNNDRGASSSPRMASQVDTIAYCEAVAQFNLGLAYHQRGKQCGEDRTLLGALELYGQSLATLQTIQDKTASQSEDVRVLRLAVTNNKIHILNEMARYPDAQAVANDFLLQSINASSSTTNDDDKSLSFLTRSDIDNFLLNALVIRRFNTAPCA